MNTMKKLEDQVGLDSALTSEAKKKVGQTKLSVNEASKQVQNAMTDVEAILKELEGLSALGECTFSVGHEGGVSRRGR